MPHRDRTLLSRRECKYVVSAEMAGRIREAIRPFVRPDGHGLGPRGDGYDISSLYLDTPDLRLMQQTLRGEKNRFKLRIRTYADGADAPVYFEVKRRVDGVILKQRARVSRDDALGLLARGLAGPRPASGPALAELVTLARMLQAGPVARVRYRREAYESATGEPVRVTFDSDVAHLITRTWELGHDGPGWQPTSIEGTVLEIKFTERYPTWLRSLVQRFELARCSVAKYALSMLDALGRERKAGACFPLHSRSPLAGVLTRVG